MEQKVQINLESNPLHKNIIIEYFDGNIDGINNLTFNFSHDYKSVIISAFDDSCNQYTIKTITYDHLLYLAGKIIDKKHKQF